MKPAMNVFFPDRGVGNMIFERPEMMRGRKYWKPSLHSL